MSRNGRAQISVAWNSGDAAPALDPLIDSPIDVAAETAGGVTSVYVIEESANQVRAITADATFTQITQTIINGPANPVMSPSRIALHGDTLYVTDTANNTIQKFTRNGGAFAYAESCGTSGTGEGELNSPTGICVYTDGRTFVCDEGENGNCRIQRFSASGPAAGAFEVAWGDATMFNFTGGAGIAVGTGGCIFVTDTGRNRIRRFQADNSLTFYGIFDGAETEVKIANINGVVVDPANFRGFDPQVRDTIAAEVAYTINGGPRMSFAADLQEPVDGDASRLFSATWSVYYGDEQQPQETWIVPEVAERPNQILALNYFPFLFRAMGLPMTQPSAPYTVQIGDPLAYQVERVGSWSYLKTGSHAVSVYDAMSLSMILATPNGGKGEAPLDDGKKAPPAKVKNPQGNPVGEKQHPKGIVNSLEITDDVHWHGQQGERWFFAGPYYTQQPKFRYKTDNTIDAGAVKFAVFEQGSTTAVFQQDGLAVQHEWAQTSFVGLDANGRQLDPKKSYLAVLSVTYKGDEVQTKLPFAVRSRTIVWYDSAEGGFPEGLSLAQMMARQAKTSLANGPNEEGSVLACSGEWSEAFGYLTAAGKMYSYGHGTKVDIDNDPQKESYGFLFLPQPNRYAGFGDGSPYDGVFKNNTWAKQQLPATSLTGYELHTLQLPNVEIHLFHCWSAAPSHGGQWQTIQTPGTGPRVIDTLVPVVGGGIGSGIIYGCTGDWGLELGNPIPHAFTPLARLHNDDKTELAQYLGTVATRNALRSYQYNVDAFELFCENRVREWLVEHVPDITEGELNSVDVKVGSFSKVTGENAKALAE